LFFIKNIADSANLQVSKVDPDGFLNVLGARPTEKKKSILPVMVDSK